MRASLLVVHLLFGTCRRLRSHRFYMANTVSQKNGDFDSIGIDYYSEDILVISRA